MVQATTTTTAPTQTPKRPTLTNTYITREMASLCTVRYGRAARLTTTIPG